MGLQGHVRVPALICALRMLNFHSLLSSYNVAPIAILRGLLLLQRDALTYNAGAEIGTGFLLIGMLATQRRAIVLTILHWNWLRMRYFSPDAAAYHSMVGIVVCANCSTIFAMLCYALHAKDT